MSSLTNRIYSELNEWKFSQLSISAALETQNIYHKRLDFVLIVISLIGVVGWFRNEEYKVFWSLILILVQATRISKNLFLKSTEQQFSMKNSTDFYNHYLRDLENLFYDYYEGKFSDQNVEKKLRYLQDEERNIFGKQTFGRIKLSKKTQKELEHETDNYLIKLKNNLNY